MRVRGMPSPHGPRGDGPVLRCRDRGVPRRRVPAAPIPRHAEGAPPPLVRRLGPLGHLLLRPGDRLRLGMVRGLVQAVLLLRDPPRGLPRRGDPRPRPPPPEGVPGLRGVRDRIRRRRPPLVNLPGGIAFAGGAAYSTARTRKAFAVLITLGAALPAEGDEDRE